MSHSTLKKNIREINGSLDFSLEDALSNPLEYLKNFLELKGASNFSANYQKEKTDSASFGIVVKIKKIRMLTDDFAIALCEPRNNRKENRLTLPTGQVVSQATFVVEKNNSVSSLIKEGNLLYSYGYWHEDSRFGWQFKCTDISSPMVETEQEISKWLLSKKSDFFDIHEKVVSEIVSEANFLQIPLSSYLASPKELLKSNALQNFAISSLEVLAAEDKGKNLDEKITRLTLKGDVFFKRLVAKISQSWIEYRSSFAFSEYLSLFGVSKSASAAIFEFIYAQEQEKKKDGTEGALHWLKVLPLDSFFDKFPLNLQNIIFEIFYRNIYKYLTVKGVGFFTLDKIALNVGYKENDKRRIAGGIIHVLTESSSEGNSVIPQDLFFKSLRTIFPSLQTQEISDVVKELKEQYKLVPFKDLNFNGQLVSGLSLDYLFIWEYDIAKKVSHLMNIPTLPKENKMRDYILSSSMFNDETQRNAVLTSCENSISIITGGPGTGKTYTVNLLTQVLSQFEQGRKIYFLAPTGRAAKRIKEAVFDSGSFSESDKEKFEIPSTIHLFLAKRKKDNEGLVHNATFIIDESSMIDTLLMSQFVKTLGENVRLVFFGDVDQIPPVGIGQVMSDLIKIGVKTSYLTTIHRVKSDSKIPFAAKSIKEGVLIETSSDFLNEDFTFLHVNKEGILPKMQQVVDSLLRNGILKENIQIITPNNGSELGVHNLNRYLRWQLNKNIDFSLFRENLEKEEIEIRNTKGIYKPEFKVGERIINTKNDYILNLFNGEVGELVSFDNNSEEIFKSDEDFFDSKEDLFGTEDNSAKEAVEFHFKPQGEQKVIAVTKTPAKNFTFAYAITVHKAQGSESPVVIMPITSSHFRTLNKKLIYTGITRAKNKIILIGEKRVLLSKISDKSNLDRLTSLERCFNNLEKYKDYYNKVRNAKSEIELFLNESERNDI